MRACMYVSQSDYLSCDLYKQQSGTREKEKHSLFVHLYIYMMQMLENVNYAEIRDDYPQSTLDEHIVS